MKNQISETLSTLNNLKTLFAKKKVKSKFNILFNKCQSPKKSKKKEAKIQQVLELKKKKTVPKQRNFMSKLYQQILDEKSLKTKRLRQSQFSQKTPKKQKSKKKVIEYQTPAFIFKNKMSN